jgi:hypothetical protein
MSEQRHGVVCVCSNSKHDVGAASWVWCVRVLEFEFAQNRTPPGLRAQFTTKVVGVVCVCSNVNSLEIEHRLACERNSQPRL